MGFFGTLVLKSFFQNPDFLDFLWQGGGGGGGVGGLGGNNDEACPTFFTCM